MIIYLQGACNVQSGSRNCECIDMQKNVAVDFPVAVLHGVAFNLFAHAMNVCGS